MKEFSHLNTAIDLIQRYRGDEPLHHFLKKFFALHKKYGSKDRRRISHLCYVYFRVARAFKHSTEDRSKEQIKTIVLAGLYLTNEEKDPLLAVSEPSWYENSDETFFHKVQRINAAQSSMSFEINNLFPSIDQLSEGIDHQAFLRSQLQQPSPFVRIRPGYKTHVLGKLENERVDYTFIEPAAVQLPIGFKIENYFALDKEVVVQDLSSQKIGDFFSDHTGSRGITSVWDCCAASGGKSILAYDKLQNIDLTVSDVRESILINLKKRFFNAGISKYRSAVYDLSGTGFNSNIKKAGFDLIIADLPCTGSGTWGRTPEQLYFFDAASIERYSRLQKKILKNIIPYLKPTGKLLYITCSVFVPENEEIVNYLKTDCGLNVEKSGIIKGYDQNADTMFAALFTPS